MITLAFFFAVSTGAAVAVAPPLRTFFKSGAEEKLARSTRHPDSSFVPPGSSSFLDQEAEAGLPLLGVEFHTSPTKARVWVFPVDQVTGWPLPERRIGPRPGELSPVRYDLAPGEYLVVADLGKGRFAEVFRQVPERSDQTPWFYRNLHWERLDEESVRIDIAIRPLPRDDSLVFIPGGEFETAAAPGQPTQRLRIPAYYLASKELTLAEFEDAHVRLPKHLEGVVESRDHAMGLINYDEAVDVLERLGFRPPTEFEWEYAARLGEVDWNAIQKEAASVDGFGPAGFPASDIVGPLPGIFGLHSNRAEWTSSWAVPRPWERSLPLVHEGMVPGRLRVVKGGNEAVQRADKASILPVPSERDPSLRFSVDRFTKTKPGLGVRAARSIGPRLEPADFLQVIDDAALEASQP